MSGMVLPAEKGLRTYDLPRGGGQPPPGGHAGAQPSLPDAAGEAGTEVREDAEALRRAAYEEGMAEGRRQARESLAGELERLRREHAEALRRAEERWQRDAGQRLGQALTEALAALEEALGQQVGQALRPLLGEAARRRAVARLGDMLRRMLAEDGALRVRVSGPAALLEALQRSVGALAERISVEVAEDDVELVAHVDNTVVETRVECWVRAALADDDDGRSVR